MADENTGATYGSTSEAEQAARDAWAGLEAEGVTEDIVEPGEEQQDEVDEGSTPDGESVAADESADDSEYEEEESPEESTEESQQDTESESTEEEKTFWDQYEDEPARKKAFNETKEYAAKMSKLAREREQKIKDLEARLSTPAVPEKPKEPAPDPAQRLETTYKKLYETDSRVQEHVAGLSQLKTQIDSGQQQLGAIDKELSELATGISEKNAQLKYVKKKIEADPDDLSMKEEERILVSELMSDRARHNELRIARQETSFSVNGQIQGYNENIVKLRDYVRSHQEKEEAQIVEAEELDALQAEIHEKWQEAAGRWMEENSIPEEDVERVNALLARMAAAESKDVDETHLYEWMRDKGGKLILEERKRIEERAMKQYATQKRKDAAQPAPKGTIKKPKEGSKPQTIDDLIADSGKALTNEFMRAGGLR
jgi:hypothetical protein